MQNGRSDADVEWGGQDLAFRVETGETKKYFTVNFFMQFGQNYFESAFSMTLKISFFHFALS